MFSGIKSNIAQERASLVRDMEFIRQNVKDAQIQETMLICEACGGGGKLYTETDLVSREEEKEICNAITRIPGDDTSSEEINRILTSNKPELSLDEVMGISAENEPTPTDIAYACMTGCDEACDTNC